MRTRTGGGLAALAVIVAMPLAAQRAEAAALLPNSTNISTILSGRPTRLVASHHSGGGLDSFDYQATSEIAPAGILDQVLAGGFGSQTTEAFSRVAAAASSPTVGFNFVRSSGSSPSGVVLSASGSAFGASDGVLSLAGTLSSRRHHRHHDGDDDDDDDDDDVGPISLVPEPASLLLLGTGLAGLGRTIRRRLARA